MHISILIGNESWADAEAQKYRDPGTPMSAPHFTTLGRTLAFEAEKVRGGILYLARAHDFSRTALSEIKDGLDGMHLIMHVPDNGQLYRIAWFVNRGLKVVEAA